MISFNFRKKENIHFRRSKESFMRGLIFLFIDLLLISICSVLALLVRFDFSFQAVDPRFWESLVTYYPWNLAVTIFCFWLAKLYSSLWRFASLTELFNILIACVVTTLIQTVGMHVAGLDMPRSYPFLYVTILTIFITASRFAYRILRDWYQEKIRRHESDPVRTMVFGAGRAGYMIVREMLESKHLNRDVRCIIDDDQNKTGTYLHGVPIVGNRDHIIECAEKYDIQEIVIAIPTLSTKERRKILEICNQTDCNLRTLPGMYQMVNDEVNVSMLREVEIDDLLGREPIQLEMESVIAYVKDQVVLVTGGGGSIGSEICRQVAANHPKQLLIVDIYENNAYELQMELQKKFPELNLVVLIASVRNSKRLHWIFDKYRPDLVFHAAAHKHVPLMETSPNEAIKNNVIGTFHVAREADIFHVKKMILISTDKAVRPTNIMGASKRICEMVIQEFSQKSKTEFAAVRFGNVLGSNGSVIPLFKKQIAEGGPVTVTHPDIIRYFMTIPEAVSLVLQAGALAKGGEIFILDMGEPVKILDLAKNMIRLSGLREDDIEIRFVGLRPGEKLYEELLINEANLVGTQNEKIFVCQQDTVDIERLKSKMKTLYEAAYNESDNIRQLVKELVPEYHEAEQDENCPKQNVKAAI